MGACIFWVFGVLSGGLLEMFFCFFVEALLYHLCGRLWVDFGMIFEAETYKTHTGFLMCFWQAFVTCLLNKSVMREVDKVFFICVFSSEIEVSPL